MGIATGIAIYFLIWWIVLFAVLPWGVKAREQEDLEAVPGSDPGAPRVARVWAKLIWTTLVATVVFAACAFVYLKGLVTLDDLARVLRVPEFKP
jgi:predicted secreted protein